ncbi:MAG: hypothetical protein ACSHWW_05685 [Nonlabens sp.]|uniref:hypothetical protein n=1 Tax=Nonlabens sp. TaxID=1888209 RepID=UPI003EF29C17
MNFKKVLFSLILLGLFAMNSITAAAFIDYRLETFNLDRDSEKEEIFSLIKTLRETYKIEAKLTAYKTRGEKIINLGFTFVDQNSRTTNLHISTDIGIPEVCIVIDDDQMVVAYAGSCEKQEESRLKRDPEQLEQRRMELYERAERLKAKKEREQEALEQRKSKLEKTQAASRQRQEKEVVRKREAMEAQKRKLKEKADLRRKEVEANRKRLEEEKALHREAIETQRKGLQEKSESKSQEADLASKREVMEAQRKELQEKAALRREEAAARRVQTAQRRDSLIQSREALMEQKRVEYRARINKQRNYQDSLNKVRNNQTVELTIPKKTVSKAVELSSRTESSLQVPSTVTVSDNSMDIENTNSTIESVRKAQSGGNVDDLKESGAIFFSGEQCSFKTHGNKTFIYDGMKNTILVLNAPLGDDPARGTTVLKGVTYNFEFDGLSLSVKNKEGLLINKEGNLLNPLASFTDNGSDSNFQQTNEFVITAQSNATEIRTVIQELNKRGFEFLIQENVSNPKGNINYFAFKINGKSYSFKEYEGIPVVLIQIDESHKKARVQTAE